MRYEILNKKTTPQLKLLAQRVFNAWIRERDKDLPCISCGGKGNQAGHYFSAGANPGLRLNEINVNLQCPNCNMYQHGNLIAYRQGLIRKYGSSVVDKLENDAAIFKRNGYKWDRNVLIDTIVTYRKKIHDKDFSRH